MCLSICLPEACKNTSCFRAMQYVLYWAKRLDSPYDEEYRLTCVFNAPNCRATSYVCWENKGANTYHDSHFCQHGNGAVSVQSRPPRALQHVPFIICWVSLWTSRRTLCQWRLESACTDLCTHVYTYYRSFPKVWNWKLGFELSWQIQPGERLAEWSRCDTTLLPEGGKDSGAVSCSKWRLYRVCSPASSDG